MEFGEIGAGAVRQDEAVDPPVIGLTHRGMDAHLGGDAADDELGDAMFGDQVAQFGVVEGALAGLVDHRLARDRIEFGDDVVTKLSDYEDAAHRALVADRHLALAADLLGLVQIAQIGLVALAGVHDQHPRRAARREQRLERRDRPAQL